MLAADNADYSFFMGLYINSKEFFINFFELMKKCSTLNTAKTALAQTNLTIFWKST